MSLFITALGCYCQAKQVGDSNNVTGIFIDFHNPSYGKRWTLLNRETVNLQLLEYDMKSDRFTIHIVEQPLSSIEERDFFSNEIKCLLINIKIAKYVEENPSGWVTYYNDLRGTSGTYHGNYQDLDAIKQSANLFLDYLIGYEDYEKLESFTEIEKIIENKFDFLVEKYSDNQSYVEEYLISIRNSIKQCLCNYNHFVSDYNEKKLLKV